MSGSELKSAKERLVTLVGDLKHRVATTPVDDDGDGQRRFETRRLQLKAARLEAKLDSLEDDDGRVGSALDLDLKSLEREIETLIPATDTSSR